MTKITVFNMRNVEGGATISCKKCGQVFKDNFWKRLFGQSAKNQYNAHLSKRSLNYCGSIALYYEWKKTW